MTEEQIKEMLNGIINNGEKWEYRWCTADGWSNWKDYKLGYEIFDDYEYRKVEYWSVIEWNDTHSLEVRSLQDAEDIIGAFIQITFKTKEECEKWIEEHTKKTWLDERKSCLSVSFEKKEINCYEAGVKETCKKILEEIRTHEGIEQLTKFYIAEIIKNLGIELCSGVH